MEERNKTSNTSKTIKGISSQTIVTLGLGALEIISFSIMSRLLTKEDFGYFAAITAATTIFSSLSETGIGSAIIQRKDINKHYINNAFSLSLLVGLTLSLILAAFSRPISIAIVETPKMTVPLMLMSLTILGQCLISVNKSIMYKRLEFLKVGLINLIAFVISFIIELFLALKGYGYYAIVARATVVTIATLILSYFFVKTKFSFEINKSEFKKIFSFSGWLMASSLVRNLSQEIDKLMMTRLLSVQALGAYNRPKEFVNRIVGKLNSIFDTALFPVLSDIQYNKTSLRNALSKSLFFLNIFGMAMASALIVNSELMIRIFFGKEWLSLKILVQIFSFYMILNVNGRLMDCFIRSLGLTKMQFYFRVIQLVITIIGLFIGANWGMVGIAVSVIIANLVIVISKLVYVTSHLNSKFKFTLQILLESWRFAIFVVPIYILSLFFFKDTLQGNIILLGVYVGLMLIMFLVFPELIGVRYKNEVHTKLVNFIKAKIRRNG